MVPHEESFVRNALPICERLGTNMIVDEVWSGVHHFGPFFMTEMYGIAPHFIVLAKSLGGGISKLAAVLARRDVALRTESPGCLESNGEAYAVGHRVVEFCLSHRQEIEARGSRITERFVKSIREISREHPSFLCGFSGRGYVFELSMRDYFFFRIPHYYYLLNFCKVRTYSNMMIGISEDCESAANKLGKALVSSMAGVVGFIFSPLLPQKMKTKFQHESEKYVIYFAYDTTDDDVDSLADALRKLAKASHAFDLIELSKCMHQKSALFKCMTLLYPLALCVRCGRALYLRCSPGKGSNDLYVDSFPKPDKLKIHENAKPSSRDFSRIAQETNGYSQLIDRNSDVFTLSSVRKQKAAFSTSYPIFFPQPFARKLHKTSLERKLSDLVYSETGIAMKPHFVNTPGEAVEAVIKCCAVRFYTRLVARGQRPNLQTARIIAFSGACHGLTPSTMTLSGAFAETLASKFARFTVQYVEPTKEGLHRLLDDKDKLSTVLGIIAQPFHVESGNCPFDSECIGLIHCICNESNCALVLDESQTGLYRGGALMLGHELGFVPHAVVFSHGLNGCFGQMAAIMLDSSEFKGVTPSDMSFSTFSNDALSCAMALSSIDNIMSSREALTAAGKFFREELESTVRKHQMIGSWAIQGLTAFVAFSGQIGYASNVARHMRDASTCVHISVHNENALVLQPTCAKLTPDALVEGCRKMITAFDQAVSREH